MEKKQNELNEQNVGNNENKEFKSIKIGLEAEINRMRNLLNRQMKTGVINQKEYYYFENYYILNLAEKN